MLINSLCVKKKRKNKKNKNTHTVLCFKIRLNDRLKTQGFRYQSLGFVRPLILLQEAPHNWEPLFRVEEITVGIPNLAGRSDLPRLLGRDQ